MIPSCFQETLEDFHMFEGMEGMPPLASSAVGGGGGPGLLDAQTDTLIYRLSLLEDRIQQVRALVGTLVFSADQIQSVATAIESVGSLAQEIIAAASAILPAIQQSALHAALVPAGVLPMNYPLPHDMGGVSGPEINYSINQSNSTGDHRMAGSDDLPMGACDIVELDAADLLAMHTHHCPVCGKGFKRGANLRMHMRAHGDEYKAAGALSNPVKRCGAIGLPPRKYSCPQDGCRWNSRHARFHPLKSMVCVRRHYRRSHCPKMYVCRRCGGKRFSLLSDLRSHEKHCGRLRRWRCSCGTIFSRKDKLMGHVALFLGHAPDASCFKNQGEPEFQVMQP